MPFDVCHKHTALLPFGEALTSKKDPRDSSKPAASTKPRNLKENANPNPSLFDVCDKHIIQALQEHGGRKSSLRSKTQTSSSATDSLPPAHIAATPSELTPRDTCENATVAAVSLRSFAADAAAATVVAQPTSNKAVIRENFNIWLEKLRQSGLRIPRKPGGGIAYATIAQELSVNLSIFQPRGALRKTLTEVVKELGTMPHNEYLQQRYGDSARRDNKTFNYGDQSAYILQKYLSILEAERGIVPESTHEVGTLSYHKVLKAAKIRYPTGKLEYAKGRLFRLIDETASRLGLGPKRHRLSRGANGGTLTYEAAAALDIETSSRRGQAPTTKARRKSCLSAFRVYAGKLETDLVGIELGSEFDKVLECLAANYSNTDTRRHFISDAEFWKDLLKPHIIATDLPPNLGDALSVLMRERGVSNATRLAEIANVGSATMQNWLRGEFQPRHVDCPALGRLESYFDLAAGTLTRRVSLTWGKIEMREEAWPPCLQNSNLRRRVRQYLPPDFANLPDSEREAVGRKLLKSTVSTIAYRRSLCGLRPWRMKQFPAILATQWDSFVAYKSEYSAGKLKRNDRWGSSETAGRAYTQYLTFFSSLTLSSADFGLGLDEDNFTLAYLISPTLVEWHVEWLRKRADEVLHTGIRTFLGEVCSFLRPETGYLWQKPELAHSLIPITGHVFAEDIELWKSDPKAWTDACAETHRRLTAFRKAMEEDFEFRRDPFEPIKPILAAQRPLDLLHQLLADAYDNLPPKTADKALERAVALRDFLLYATLVETALRLKNLTCLDFRMGGKGRLRKENDHYVLEIPAEEFKNSKSSFFRQGLKRRNRIAGVKSRPYRKILPKHLTPLFDEYLEPDVGGRAILRALKTRSDRKSTGGADAVWVSRFGTAATKAVISAVCFRLTKRYIAYNENTGTGVPGVEPFSAHAVRHIGATHILKVTGLVAIAAAHLQDTDEVVATTYARFLPEDKTALATAMLEKDRAPPLWEVG